METPLQSRSGAKSVEDEKARQICGGTATVFVLLSELVKLSLAGWIFLLVVQDKRLKRRRDEYEDAKADAQAELEMAREEWLLWSRLQPHSLP